MTDLETAVHYRRMAETALVLACRQLEGEIPMDLPEYFVPDLSGWYDLFMETAAGMMNVQAEMESEEKQK